MKKFNKKDYAVFAIAIVLVVAAMSYQQKFQADNAIYFPRDLTADEVKKYANNDTKAILIYPILTQYAYKDKGFYDYFKGTCKTCNIISLRPLEINATYTTGLNSFSLLTQLHYPFVTDIFVDKHPELLKDYDTVILLHNEYMTKNEFNAIKNHKNVLYLYPNSMYVEVAVDYDKLTMSLVRGHGYPDKTISNGFDYVTSSKGEYDLNCQNYKWEEIPNGIQTTCWPEFLIKADRHFLQEITDYPQKIPKTIPMVSNQVNITKIPHCDQYGNCS